MNQDRDFAKVLWNYNQLDQDNTPADFILLMCSYNLDVADHAYDLFQSKLSDKIILSGGIAHTDDLLNTGWDKPEAYVFRDRLLCLGMAEKDLIIEDQSTNCGENILFSKDILKHEMPNAAKGLIAQKPYMGRRAYATACKQWPQIKWHINTPKLSYEDYIQKHDEERLIHIMVGDTARIIDYADKGYQIPQDMPDEVKNALDILIEKGYKKHINN